MSKEETLAEFSLFLKSMKCDISELRKDFGKLKASSPSKSHKELQELKQGSMSVKEYFDEMHIVMLRAKVRESSDATMDRFLNGLNPSISKQMEFYPYSDIKGMVSIAIELEKHMKKKERYREKEKIEKERETYEKELDEKRKRENEIESEIKLKKITESDLSEKKMNPCVDDDKEHVEDEIFVDANHSFPHVILSTQQELAGDNDTTKILRHAEYDPQESRTTLLQERENDRISGGTKYVDYDVLEAFIQSKGQRTIKCGRGVYLMLTWRMTWIIAWTMTWMTTHVELHVTCGRTPPKPPWHVQYTYMSMKESNGALKC